MSASLIIATILVTGWNLVLITTILLTDPQSLEPTQKESRRMSPSIRSVRAEVGKPEIDARTSAWKRDREVGPLASASSRILETQREVMRPAPYAEASVTVVGDEGDEVRRCSICMN